MILWVGFRQTQIITGVGLGVIQKDSLSSYYLFFVPPDTSVDLVFSLSGAEYGIL